MLQNDLGYPYSNRIGYLLVYSFNSDLCHTPICPLLMGVVSTHVHVVRDIRLLMNVVSFKIYAVADQPLAKLSDATQLRVIC